MLMPAVAFHLETIWFDMQIKWLVLYEMEHWAEMFYFLVFPKQSSHKILLLNDKTYENYL